MEKKTEKSKGKEKKKIGRGGNVVLCCSYRSGSQKSRRETRSQKE
jgi:hypothetical protein